MFSILVLVLGAQPSIPMPFPLPVNFSFGVCGMSPVGMPSCSASMAFVASKTNPLSTNCAHTSALQPLKCAPVHSCNTQIYVSNVDLFTPRSLPMNHPLSLLTPFLCTFDVSLTKRQCIYNTQARPQVTCSSQPGCSTSCKSSSLFQSVFARFQHRLDGVTNGTSASSPPNRGSSNVAVAAQNQNKNPPAPAHTAAAAAAAPVAGISWRHWDTDANAATDAYWWRLNNINCNLHDMPGARGCRQNSTITECQSICAANPACGGFLYYTKSKGT